MSKPYIIWLGPCVDEATMLSYPAVSPAANRWQRGLIAALQELGMRVVTIGHLPEPLWPRGKLRIGGSRGVMPLDIEGQLIDYWNVPGWRNRSLSMGYLEAFQVYCQREGNPTAVISYNATPPNVAVGMHAQEELGIPWICIVADLTGLEWECLVEILEPAAGCIFLSWGSCRDFPYNPKLHLDGGIDRLKLTINTGALKPSSQKTVVLYTGAMGHYAGVSFLAQGFRQVKNQEVELWICGKGTNLDVEQAVAVDPRVKFLGFVSEERLREISQAATIFVNPRPSWIVENRANFPSKILEYLSYGKPVVSTWTGGLSPAYREILVVLGEETSECLARTIENVLRWDAVRYRDFAARARSFLEAEKTWSVQASRLMEWLNREVVSHTQDCSCR